MPKQELASPQRLQEEEYAYPYHYIPTLGDGRFSQTQHWPWGLQYMAGIEVVLAALQGLGFESLVDIGCGDGRFLREAAERFPEARLLGVDYSERSIALARAMNATLHYEVRNVIEEPLEACFDVVTSVEVLEHIPPGDVERFVAAMAAALKPAGHLVLTVPHSSMPVQAKHFQHFDSADLARLLSPYFGALRFVPFDRASWLWALLRRALGGQGEHLVLTDRRLMHGVYRLYQRTCLYVKDEAQCQRIAVVARRASTARGA